MEALRLRKASHPLPPMDDVAQYEHFVKNFRLIGALLQVEVVFGFSAKS